MRSISKIDVSAAQYAVFSESGFAADLLAEATVGMTSTWWISTTSTTNDPGVRETFVPVRWDGDERGP
ncbi:hypothetical protein [Microbispora sp. H13382]|uniref:hypothetical protein n=1 Tax=Microbispora sp. H13382 TaxID=2729112 RepID=UPI0015FFAB4E|nr:hypothetical protein [Microbispora sp. H13382]